MLGQIKTFYKNQIIDEKMNINNEKLIAIITNLKSLSKMEKEFLIANSVLSKLNNEVLSFDLDSQDLLEKERKLIWGARERDEVIYLENGSKLSDFDFQLLDPNEITLKYIEPQKAAIVSFFAQNKKTILDMTAFKKEAQQYVENKISSQKANKEFELKNMKIEYEKFWNSADFSIAVRMFQNDEMFIQWSENPIIDQSSKHNFSSFVKIESVHSNGKLFENKISQIEEIVKLILLS